MLRYDAGEVITAMVTPMDKERRVDYNGMEVLAKHLTDNGTDTILVAGTTGESPTLTFEEELELLGSVRSVVGKTAKIVMGAGSNCTATAINAAKKAAAAGADALLSVVPYYNKPSQKGLYEHFSAIAKAVKDTPIILYNIPVRTGSNMSPDTVAKLANDFDNIVALKQSFPDLDVITELKEKLPSDVAIYCGDDSLTLPMLSLGAHGVISVASHVVGKDVKAMVRAFKEGRIEDALKLHLHLAPLFRKLFMAPNPVPVKYALSKVDIIGDYVRRPLVELSEDEKIEFLKVFKNYL
ncbi:4-hydroxy-tetrahydrodipicolinate synthase [bacterium]|nr:4-hydroxy-tetrahydrodipicolinate synthase [bacterium]